MRERDGQREMDRNEEIERETDRQTDRDRQRPTCHFSSLVISDFFLFSNPLTFDGSFAC